MRRSFGLWCFCLLLSDNAYLIMADGTGFLSAIRHASVFLRYCFPRHHYLCALLLNLSTDTGMSKSILLFAAATLLAGCATHYNVDSNLNPQNVKTYFAPSTITLYEKSSELEGVEYKNIGHVQGDVCQADSRDKPASLTEARNVTLRKVQEMGGNGLLLNQCLMLTGVPGCEQLALCQGSAIIVNK
ncbi:MAG TPA: hypothetical protein DCF97_09290 [Plesiomonas shigelloides]|nr:hypothetical protein [Plesiomonas shigelloides]